MPFLHNSTHAVSVAPEHDLSETKSMDTLISFLTFFPFFN